LWLLLLLLLSCRHHMVWVWLVVHKRKLPIALILPGLLAELRLRGSEGLVCRWLCVALVKRAVGMCVAPYISTGVINLVL